MRMVRKIRRFPVFKKAKPHYLTPEEEKALRRDGKNIQIGRVLYVRGKITLRSDVVIKDSCSIDGLINIGSGTVIGEGAVLQKMVRLGKRCLIHKGAVLTSGSHGVDHATLDPQLLRGLGVIPIREKIQDRLVKAMLAVGIMQEPLVVEDNVEVGEYSVILAGVRIGKGAKILSDSVVTRSVPENGIVGGCPAKIIDCEYSKGLFLSNRSMQYKVLNPIANSEDPESQRYAVFGKYNLLAQGICVNQINDQKVVFGNDIWVGMNAILDSGIRIADGAVVGAGAHVIKDVEPYSVVAGSPARHLKWRFNEEVRNWLLSIRWWDWSEERIIKHKGLFKANLSDPYEFSRLSRINYA